jgi:hypothetical protein
MLRSPPVLPPALRGAGRPGAARHPARGARGQITWVGLLLLVLLVGGGYLAWVWGPVYVLHYEVKQVVRDYMNQAVRDRNDVQLVENMTRKLASLAQVDGVDAYGRPARLPAVALVPADVTWERNADARPPTLHVAFDYERTVTYPFLETTASRVLSVQLDNDLSTPDWGPAR